MAEVFDDGTQSPEDIAAAQDSDQQQPEQRSKQESEPEPDKRSERPSEAQKLDDLPDFWQKEIRRLRDENANRRRAQKSDAGERLHEATTERDSALERIAALEERLEEQAAAEAEARATAAKTQILAQRGLSTDFARMLPGEDQEAWEQAADSLVELRGKRGASPDPVQVAASKQSNQKTEKERVADAFFSGLT